jgi:RecA-family ATPase
MSVGVVIRVWREQPGKFFFLSSKDRGGKWRDHPFKRSEFKTMDAFVAANLDKDLYWCCHGFSKPRRLERYAEFPKLLWADLDESDPRDMPEFLPTIAWESSPGRYAALWRLTGFMVKDVNRRLTYHLKADPGGWDLTQVLRLPGTTNYKYDSAPKVKLMWADGPEYAIDDIIRKLPKERKAKESDVARGLYRKYEKHFSGWVRRQLMRGKPKPGKRSEVLWRLTNEIMEAGCTSDEAFELLRVSPWNKFSHRSNGDEQLRREIDKSTKQHMQVVDDENPREEIGRDEDEALEDDDEPEYKFLAQSMAEVEEEKLDWIWYPYFAKGELTILEGDPGLGKSYMAQMAAVAVCDGLRLPSVKPKKLEPSKVAYFDIENSAGTVTKRRLLDNGAKNLHNFFQEQEPFTIDDDETLDRVYEAIDKLRPTLVVFDTINTYMGGADIHNTSETQQAFKRFQDVARRFNCAVVVLRHLTKSTKGVSALYRGQGSIAFAGLARVVMTVGRHPEDADLRVMAVTKINVARVPKALTFSIEDLPATVKADDRSHFVWGEFVDLTADQILSAPDKTKDDEQDAVVKWLFDALSEEGMSHGQLLTMAEPRSFSAKQIDKAANELKVVRSGDFWELPPQVTEESA